MSSWATHTHILRQTHTYMHTYTLYCPWIDAHRQALLTHWHTQTQTSHRLFCFVLFFYKLKHINTHAHLLKCHFEAEWRRCLTGFPAVVCKRRLQIAFTLPESWFLRFVRRGVGECLHPYKPLGGPCLSIHYLYALPSPRITYCAFWAPRMKLYITSTQTPPLSW